MEIRDRTQKKLCIEYWLRPRWGINSPPVTKGYVQFDEGLAIQEAAAWCGMRLDGFLQIAVRDHLAEVQAAMEEERIGVS